jgi:hypothetical protein
MSSKLSNNQILLNEIIKQEFDENTQYDKVDDFFEFFTSSQVLKEYDLSYEEIENGITGAGLDGGCDGIYLFINGDLIKEDNEVLEKYKKDIKLELCILQTKNTTSFKEDAILKWKAVSKNLLELSNKSSDFQGRYNDEVLKSFELFKDTYIKLIRKKIKLKIRYLYISKGIEVHPNVMAQALELQTEIKELYPNPNVTVEIDFIGADNLMALISTQSNSNYSLKLKESPIAIDSRQDYVALVSLPDYFNFITNEKKELIKHIFESNVRDYQGHTAVNSEIQETLQNQNLEDFWWLNNGITIIASEATLVTGKEIIISEPEIVNGLQTSTEIYHYFSEHPDKIQDEVRNVLVRIVVPQSEEARDKIILATNSQTSIPKASLRATDSIHRQIELYFRSRGLYYDRRKNYYKNQGIKSSDIVSVSFLAQCLMSVLLQKPNYARARPSTLLTDDNAYETLYVKNQDLNTFYNAAYIGKKVEYTLKKFSDYTTVEKGDILFYVIYLIVVKITQNTETDSNLLANIDINAITESLIETVAEEVYSVYSELGGTGKTAKGSELIDKLKENYSCVLAK